MTIVSQDHKHLWRGGLEQVALRDEAELVLAAPAGVTHAQAQPVSENGGRLD